MTQEDVERICRRSGVLGCATTSRSGPFFRWSSIVFVPKSGRSLSDAAILAHELGHAFGLCHTIVATGVEPPFSMGVTPDGLYSPGRGQMGRFDAATVKAGESVYGAGLIAGANRRQFVAAGLVPPEPSGLGLPSSSPPGYAGAPEEILQEGLGETIVLKPFCARPRGATAASA